MQHFVLTLLVILVVGYSATYGTSQHQAQMGTMLTALCGIMGFVALIVGMSFRKGPVMDMRRLGRVVLEVACAFLAAAALFYTIQ